MGRTGSGLASLPTELLMHILQFLEVRFITGVLAQVCDGTLRARVK